MSLIFKDPYQTFETAEYSPGSLNDLVARLQKAGRTPNIGLGRDVSDEAKLFRARGGKVAAYYYGEWDRRGMSYNNFPWRWLANSFDKTPLLSIPVMNTVDWVFDNQQGDGWTVAGGTLAVPGYEDLHSTWTGWTTVDGSVVVAGSVATFTATSGTNPTFTSPAGHFSFNGTTYRKLYVNLKKLVSTETPDTSWEGKVYYTTVASPSFDEAKTVRFSQPVWALDGTAQLVIEIPDTASAWIGNTITRLRFDFWQVGNINFEISSYIQSDRIGGGFIQLTSSGSNPQFFSPNRLSMHGSEVTEVVVDVRRAAGAGWEGTLYFIIDGDETYNVAKSFNFAQPTWDGSVKTITIPTTGNATWTANTIRRIRIDFGNSASDVFELHRVALTTTPALSRSNARIVGLPSDLQWAVDWECKTAYEYGIDIFIHNFYWAASESLGVRNHRRYNLELMFRSSAESRMQHCIQWSNHDTVNPFPNTAALTALWDEWDRHFKFSNYWRIANKPVVFIFSPGNLGTWAASAALYNLGDFRLGLQRFIQEAQTYFRNKVGSFAPNGVYFVSQAGTIDVTYNGRFQNAISVNEFAGFDAVGEYNFTSTPTNIVQNASGGTLNGVLMQGGSATVSYPSAPPGASSGTAVNFSQLREAYLYNALWFASRSGAILPYMVPAIAGWDYRAWEGYNTLGSAFSPGWNAVPSVETFGMHLKDMRDVTLAYPNMNTYAGPVVTICAWNEIGEGNYIVPTRRYGFGLLEQVRDVFSVSY